MRINNNVVALNTHRQLALNNGSVSKSLEKLSSGLRINRAGDDAAGLAISEKMRAQIRGLNQASRNIQDAISLVQTAEGGLSEIHSLLQRGRELSVQSASDTLTDYDKGIIQVEVNQISLEVDAISSSTDFNTMNLLNRATSDPKAQEVLDGLKNSWLKQSVDTIINYYGINPDSVNLQINFTAGTLGGVAAYVSYSATGSSGVGTITGLTLELADYADGKFGGVEADRVIAHEMVHAIMARNINMDMDSNNDAVLNDPVIPTWFMEGAAEFIHGADERVFVDSAGGTSSVAIMTAWGAGWPDGNGTGTSVDYSASYTAVRYLHDQIKLNGGIGIKDIMTYLAGDSTRTLDDAITNASSGAFANLAGFNADFTANGGAYILGMNLANADTGAIGGLDADGGAVRNPVDVIPDTVDSGDPTTFIEIYPTVSIEASLNVQIGANQGENLTITLSSINSETLGIDSTDLVADADSSISAYNTAISTVASIRSRYGAIQNRLEHAIKVAQISQENLSNSESRIRDVDMANEMMLFTKSNIISQAAIAMLAQANQSPQGVLQLLKG